MRWYVNETKTSNCLREAQQATRGLAIMGGDKIRISTLGTLLKFGSDSTELDRTAGI